MCRWLGFWWVLLVGLPAGAAAPVDVWQAIADAVTPTPDLRMRVQMLVPGHSAAAAETLAALPVERALASVPGLQSMVSLSTEGQLRMALTLKLEPFIGLRRVADALRDLRSLPADVLPPTLARDGGARVAVLALPDAQAASALKTALQQIPGVARVAVCGPGAPEIQVEVDSRRLPPELGGAAGVVRALNGMTGADVEDLGALLLSPAVRLSDVARVRLVEPPACRCLAAGTAAVCLEVWSQAEASPAWEPVFTDATKSLPAGWSRSMPTGDRFEVWGSLASEASARALEAAVRKAAPEAWLQVWPHGFLVSAPGTASEVLGAVLDGVPGLDRAGSGRDGVESPTVWVTFASGDGAESVAVAKSVAQDLRSQGATEVRIWRPTAPPAFDIKPHREALARLGVPVAAVAQTTRLALAGQDLSRPFSKRGLRVFADRVSGPEALGGLLLTGSDGRQVPLGAVATIGTTEGAPARWRLNGQPAQPIQVSGLEGARLSRALGAVALPSGVVLVVGPDTASLFDPHR